MKIKNCYVKMTKSSQSGVYAHVEGKTYLKDSNQVLVDTRLNFPRTELGIGRAFLLNFLKQAIDADPVETDITVECVNIEQRVMNLLTQLGCEVKDMTNKPHMVTDSQGRTSIPGQNRPQGALPGETGPRRSVQEFVVDGNMTARQEAIFNKLEQLNQGDASVRFVTGEMSVEQAKQIIASASVEVTGEFKIEEDEQFKKPRYENNRLPVVRGRTLEERTENLRNIVQTLPDTMGFSVGALRIPQNPGTPFVGTNESDSLEQELRDKLSKKIEIRGNEYKLQQEASLEGTNNFSIAGENDNPIVDPSLTTPEDDYGENAPIRPSSTKKKKAIQRIGMSREKRAILESISKNGGVLNQGVGNTHMLEPAPSYVKAEVEEVIQNRYGCAIVLGKDRCHPENAHRATGYGGLGHTQCGAIDIVAGRMGPNPREINKKGEKVEVDPMFNSVSSEFGQVVDASRIYLSQKTDVDTNFNIVDGKVGNRTARSAIAVKADNVRILAMEGIKLVTSADLINSQGGDISETLGVDIIAGNNDSNLQPMLLGDNVADAFVSLSSVVSSLTGIVQDVINDLMLLNGALAAHTHPSPFFALPTFTAPMLTMICTQQMIKLASVGTFSAFSQKFNLNNFYFKYISHGGAKHIRSYYNNVN